MKANEKKKTVEINVKTASQIRLVCVGIFNLKTNLPRQVMHAPANKGCVLTAFMRANTHSLAHTNTLTHVTHETQEPGMM